METELIIDRCGFPPLSARGCTQELTLIPNGQFRRTVNGDLSYVGGVGRAKYRSRVRCNDKTIVAYETDFMQGQPVRVGCLQRVWQQVRGDALRHPIRLDRDPVDGSVVAVDANQCVIELNKTDDGRSYVVAVGDAACDVMPDVVFVSYRPWLSMQVMSFACYTDEWGLKAGWQMDLAEI